MRSSLALATNAAVTVAVKRPITTASTGRPSMTLSAMAAVPTMKMKIRPPSGAATIVEVAMTPSAPPSVSNAKA